MVSLIELPFELKILIFSNFCNHCRSGGFSPEVDLLGTCTLAGLVRTCRHLRDLCESILYHSYSTRLIGTSEEPIPARPLHPFMRTIAARPELARGLRAVEIHTFLLPSTLCTERGNYIVDLDEFTDIAEAAGMQISENRVWRWSYSGGLPNRASMPIWMTEFLVTVLFIIAPNIETIYMVSNWADTMYYPYRITNGEGRRPINNHEHGPRPTLANVHTLRVFPRGPRIVGRSPPDLISPTDYMRKFGLAYMVPNLRHLWLEDVQWLGETAPLLALERVTMRNIRPRLNWVKTAMRGHQDLNRSNVGTFTPHLGHSHLPQASADRSAKELSKPSKPRPGLTSFSFVTTPTALRLNRPERFDHILTMLTAVSETLRDLTFDARHVIFREYAIVPQAKLRQFPMLERLVVSMNALYLMPTWVDGDDFAVVSRDLAEILPATLRYLELIHLSSWPTAQSDYWRPSGSAGRFSRLRKCSPT
jgi:hypothetical protein